MWNVKSNDFLKRAVDFHGHLGPYLILGVLMGDLAIRELKFKRHFGIETVVKGALKRPKSCLIDGIQITTGCTYGKGNIRKLRGNKIQVLFRDLKNNREVGVSLKKNLIMELDLLNGHEDSETFAKKLLKIDSADLFEVEFRN